MQHLRIFVWIPVFVAVALLSGCYKTEQVTTLNCGKTTIDVTKVTVQGIDTTEGYYKFSVGGKSIIFGRSLHSASIEDADKKGAVVVERDKFAKAPTFPRHYSYFYVDPATFSRAEFDTIVNCINEHYDTLASKMFLPINYYIYGDYDPFEEYFRCSDMTAFDVRTDPDAVVVGFMKPGVQSYVGLIVDGKLVFKFASDQEKRRYAQDMQECRNADGQRIIDLYSVGQ
jgi:hypothetical protein